MRWDHKLILSHLSKPGSLKGEVYQFMKMSMFYALGIVCMYRVSQKTPSRVFWSQKLKKKRPENGI